MEVQEGFIVGIFNYCDRWCERCEFTSRCRLFADVAEAEGAGDPSLKALTDAPPRPEDIPPPLPRWMQELIEEMNEAASQPVSHEELKNALPTVSPEHESIESRARDYCFRVHEWLQGRDHRSSRHRHGDPFDVIAWFGTLIPAKIYRALAGLAYDLHEASDGPADHDGSAKVALLGIERSHVAWLQAMDRGLSARADAEPFIADLVSLGEDLERVFPKAGAFVRPGFDEPDDVAAMLARERQGCQE